MRGERAKGASTKREQAIGEQPSGTRTCGAQAWWVVSALDLFTASLRCESTWPTVLRPAAVSQRLEDGRRAARQSQASGDEAPGSGERLCALALPIAESTRIRAVHWYRGGAGTVIAETACGPETSVVLVGWAPYESGAADVSGLPAGIPAGAGLPTGAGTPDADRSSGVRTLPGALLLGIFDTGLVARRLAELAGESAAPADTVVVGRWSLPEGCPPMAVRPVVSPQNGVLRRELVAQLSEAFCRVQTHDGGRFGRDGQEADR